MEIRLLRQRISILSPCILRAVAVRNLSSTGPTDPNPSWPSSDWSCQCAPRFPVHAVHGSKAERMRSWCHRVGCRLLAREITLARIMFSIGQPRWGCPVFCMAYPPTAIDSVLGLGKGSAASKSPRFLPQRVTAYGIASLSTRNGHFNRLLAAGDLDHSAPSMALTRFLRLGNGLATHGANLALRAAGCSRIRHT